MVKKTLYIEIFVLSKLLKSLKFVLFNAKLLYLGYLKCIIIV